MSDTTKKDDPVTDAAAPVIAEPEQSAKATNVPNNDRRNKTLVIFTSVLVAIALIWFLLWLFYFRYHEWTDDANANGNLINVNTAISGSVVAFYGDDTDLVREGQLLVRLDPIPYQVAYDKALARLAATVLNVRQLYHSVTLNKAVVDAKRLAFDTASYDYQNRKQLVDSKAISNEDFIHSKDAWMIAEAEYAQAQAQLQVAVDAAGNTPIESHPLIEEAKGNVRTAFYNLQHTSVYAPATGFIAQRAANVGEWVTPNRAMMAVIPIDYVWVDANYKETQLTYMRIGQPATVTFDIYGSGVKFEGKVLGIASGTGSVFSLIPPQNATGNWIKIVQRLPVRISLDPEKLKEYPMRLGISAEVNVNLTNQDLPMLAEVLPTKPVSTTTVFDIHLEEVEKVIDEIVAMNLKPETH